MSARDLSLLMIRSELDELCTGHGSGCLPSLRALTTCVDNAPVRRAVKGHLRRIESEARAADELIARLLA